MYSTEQRIKAIETFIRFDHSYADTIAELGYPSRQALRYWWKEFEAANQVFPSKYERSPKFNIEQKQTAVNHYLEHGKCLRRTIRALGYPKSPELLSNWIDELAPGQRKYRGSNPKKSVLPVAMKVQAVAELEARSGNVAEVADKYGVSRSAPYVWRHEILQDKNLKTYGGLSASRQPIGAGQSADQPLSIALTQTRKARYLLNNQFIYPVQRC